MLKAFEYREAVWIGGLRLANEPGRNVPAGFVLVHGREPKGVELASLNSQAHGVWVECIKHSIFAADGSLEIEGFQSRTQEIESRSGQSRSSTCVSASLGGAVAFAKEGAASSRQGSRRAPPDDEISNALSIRAPFRSAARLARQIGSSAQAHDRRRRERLFRQA